MTLPHFFKKSLLCGILFIAVCAFDYYTGYETSSYPVYLLPILLAFFYFGKWGGYLLAIISTIMWATLDYLDGHYYSHELSRYWNAGCRLGIYVLFVYGMSAYTNAIAVHRRRLEEIRRLIPMCHGCGHILWRDGTWKSPEEVIAATQADLPECPSCSGQH